jgi:hypothetical protein
MVEVCREGSWLNYVSRCQGRLSLRSAERIKELKLSLSWCCGGKTVLLRDAPRFCHRRNLILRKDDSFQGPYCFTSQEG